jgi:hypothetical protein
MVTSGTAKMDEQQAKNVMFREKAVLCLSKIAVLGFSFCLLQQTHPQKENTSTLTRQIRKRPTQLQATVSAACQLRHCDVDTTAINRM